MKNPFEKILEILSDEEKPRETLEEKLENDRKAIEQLKSPIQRLLVEIEKGGEKYGLIIGDDVSGRIPTLILGKVIEEIYEDNKHTKPKIIFLAGSHSGFHYEVDEKKQKRKSSKILDYLNKIGLKEGKRVLISTEVIAYGNALKPLCDALTQKGIKFDIATVGFHPPFYYNNEIIKKYQKETDDYLGGKIFYGMIKTPDLYDRKETSGVKKNPKKVLSEPATRFFLGKFKDEKKQERLVEARKTADSVAKEIIDELRLQKNDLV